MKKVLIIEDEEGLRTILTEELSEHGFEVNAVIEGGQAVFDAVKNFMPDLIVLDLLLPKMHGFEIMEKLSMISSVKPAPILVLSNLDRDDDIKRSLALGATDYFVKSKHQLREVIQVIKERAL